MQQENHHTYQLSCIREMTELFAMQHECYIFPFYVSIVKNKLCTKKIVKQKLTLQYHEASTSTLEMNEKGI